MTPNDIIKCMSCGVEEHAYLIDAKPEFGANPETADFTRLECIACYGPNWCPLSGTDDIALSIAPKLAGHYTAWLTSNRKSQ